VLDRAVLVVHIEVRGQLMGRDAGVPGQQLAHACHAGVEPVDLGVHLDPVAGGDHERFRDVRQPGHIMQQLAQRVVTDRGALQDRYRRALVAKANDEDAHSYTAYASAAA
jgi:hypothetical protein